MNRNELKKQAFSIFKKNYFKIILVVFVIGIIVNGGYRFTTVLSGVSKIQKNGTNNYAIVNQLLDNISNKISSGGYDNGVIGTIFNSATENNSMIIGALNVVNMYFFNKKISTIYLSLIGVILLFLIKVFIQDVFLIGYKRYFLEQRRYITSSKKVLFPFQVKKNINIADIILVKNFCQFMWYFTIVGGVIKRYEYYMIPYILAENPDISKDEAFRLSREMMDGYKWELFKLELSFIGWFILNIFTFGLLDIFFLVGYKQCVYAEVYMKLRQLKKNKLTDGHLLNDDKLDIKSYVESEYPMEEYSIPVKKKVNKINYNIDYTKRNYILMFFIFSMIGWIWEVFYHMICDGNFVNRGTMFGPWLPIYGVGGVIILIVLKPLRKRPILFFISAMSLCGIIEYFTGWYLETFKGAKWWDYTGYFLNINGRVCLEGLIVFGLGGSVVTYFIGPLLNELLDKLKPKIRIFICVILLVLYGIDFIYSFHHPNKGDGITDYEIVDKNKQQKIRK